MAEDLSLNDVQRIATIVRAAARVEVATAALLDCVVTDNSRHGGLLSRDTIRAADELRIARATWFRAARGNESETEGEPTPS